MSAGPLLLTILGIGFMVFIHELGHYLAARAARIRILVFSLGFGPRVLGFRRGGCDYRLSLVPFGGYVLVAGADNFERRHLSADELNAKSAAARTLYYAGGVLMNVAFALIVFPIVFHRGVEFTAPVIGNVLEGGVGWQADLRPGDRVRKIDGKAIYSFDNLRVEIALAGRNPVELEIERDGQILHKVVQTEYDEREGFRRISVLPQVEPVPAEIRVRPGSPAAQAGLRDGDRLLAIDGVPVPPAEADRRLSQLEHSAEGTLVRLQVQRGDAVQEIAWTPQPGEKASRIGIRPVQSRVVAVRHSFAPAAGLHPGDEIVAVDGVPFADDRLRAPQEGGTMVVRVRRGTPPGEVDVRLVLTPEQAASLADNVVLTLPDGSAGIAVLVSDPNGPAARGGLRDGDRIVTVGGEAVSNWGELSAAVRGFSGGALELGILRDGEARTIKVDPARVLDLGFTVQVNYLRELYKVDGVGNAIHAGLVCSADMLKQLYVTLKEMLTGDVSARNLGGIIQISRVSYAFAESGFVRFLYFLAMLSLNLAFVNVLPIPVLDGGHLLFLLIEKIKGSPVSAKVHGYSLTLGLVFVVGLMVFVTYNDILRLF